MRINSLIRDHIKDRGVTYTSVSKKSGIDIKKLSRMMTLKQKITTEEYEVIVRDGLGLPLDYFFRKKFLDTKNTA